MKFICDSCGYETSARLNPKSFECPECDDVLRIITDKYPKQEKKKKLPKHIPREKEDVDLKIHNHRTGFTWDGASTILSALLLLTFVVTPASAVNIKMDKEPTECVQDSSVLPFDMQIVYLKLKEDDMEISISCFEPYELIIETGNYDYIHTIRKR